MSAAGKQSLSDRKRLLRLMKRGLQSLAAEYDASPEPCPDSPTMVDYTMGDLDEERTRKVSRHIALCRDCFADFLALLGPEKVERLLKGERVIGADWRKITSDFETEERVSLPITVQHAKEKWKGLVARAKEFAIDLGRTYGPGALIGLVKILAEGPALAVRGAAAPTYALSKLIEVPIEDNVYGIEISESEEGMLFDVAGYKTSRLAPLAITVSLESEEELIVTQTDKYGNARFILPRDRLGAEELLLTFALGDKIREAFFLRLQASRGAS